MEDLWFVKLRKRFAKDEEDKTMKHTKNIKECKRVLIDRAKQSLRKGYVGDWSEHMFRWHILDLLPKIVSDRKALDKIQQDIDFYIKEYPEQLEKLSNKSDKKQNEVKRKA